MYICAMQHLATLLDKEVIELKYKIVQIIKGTNKLVYKIGKHASLSCDDCTMYPETMEHLFFDCVVVNSFWFKLFDNIS